MKDEKKDNSTLGKLIHLAQSRRSKDKEKEERPDVEHDLEMELDDPTREQQTPEELSAGEQPEELTLDDNSESSEKSKLGPLSKLSVFQRVVLVVIVGLVVIGGNKLVTGSGSSNAVIENGQVPANDSGSDSINQGLEPIEQGQVAQDHNAIDVTGNEQHSNQTEDELEMVSLEPPSEGAEPVESVPASSEDSLEPPQSAASYGDAEPPMDQGTTQEITATSQPQSDDEYMIGEFDGSGFSLDENPDEKQVESPTVNGSSEDFVSLRNKVDELSHSVASIEQSMVKASKSNQQLASKITSLMAALETKDRQLDELNSRPELSDLVIFTAAANCKTCVPHALFHWNDTEYEVGDGLQWNGYNVAIRGDRLTLRNETDQFHYWYR